MTDVRLTYAKYLGVHYYQVWVNEKVYDSFVGKWPLTWSEMTDVEAGYREALDFEE